MGRALGIDTTTANLRILPSDVGAWAAMPRKRVLFSTLPCVTGPLPPEREWPWSYARGPRASGEMPPSHDA
eukprot:3772392-Lingulodinium_polyedra.AAC.1